MTRIHKKLIKARRRYLLALVAKPCALVLAAALVVGIWVHWQVWSVGITPLVLLSVVAFQLKGRLPSLYKMAQILDRRANLHDTVSTAWFFAEHPNAAAHIATADRCIAQVELRTVFPLPRTSLIAAVSFAVLLVVAGSVRTASTGLATAVAGPSQHDARKPATGARATGVASERKPAHEEAVPRNADAVGDVAGGQSSSPSTQSHERTPIPDMEAERSALQSGLDEASRSTGQRDKAGTSPAPAAAPPAASKGETGQNDRRHEPSPEARDHSAHSFVSQLLSPLKRLFGASQGKENNTRANSDAETATAAASSKQAAEKDPQSTAAVAPDQRPALPDGAQYGSADASQTQAASKKRTGLPSSIATTTVRPPTDPAATLTARSNPQAIGRNAEGERGHARVQAMRAAAAPAHTVAFNFDHHGEATRLSAREEVPLAYRTSIQAYMQEKQF